MLRKLFEEGYLNPFRILIKEQVRLNISPEEVIILSALLTLTEKKKNTVSIYSLSKLTTMNSAKVGEVFNQLIDNGFVHTELELKSDGKEKEVFSMEPFFNKIEALFLQDIQERDATKGNEDIAYVLNYLEKSFDKPLKPLDIEIVKEWFTESYSRTDIEKAIKTSLDHHRKTVSYVDRVLRSDDVYESKLDDNKKKALEKLIRGIK